MEDNEIFVTQDGSHSLQSGKYGVSYHSRYGAVQESRHVFLEAGLFPLFIAQPEKLSILELGLGTGLNALLTLLEAERREVPVEYTALEAYPLTSEQAGRLNYPETLQLDSPDVFKQIHNCKWGEANRLTPNYTFTKLEMRFEDMAFEPFFDLVYFDAFSPNAQPELWEEEVLAKVAKAMKPGGVLVTYCAKGAVKRRMKRIGLQVEALQGPPGKREMTRATKPAA